MIRPVHLMPASVPVRAAPAADRAAPAQSFDQVLQSELGAPDPVRFSAHAQERLDRRNVTLTGSDQRRLDHAVHRLASKGSKESLVLMDRLALVVSVPNRTVITVVPRSEAGTIFTNIDSAVVVPTDGAAPQG